MKCDDVVMITFLQHLLNGILYGAIYALVSSGLSLMYGVMGVVNFAHGECYMLGAYIMFLFLCLTNNFFIGVIAAASIVGIVGVLVEKFIIRPTIVKHFTIPLLATLGLGLFLKNSALIIFGARPIFPKINLVEQTFTFYGLRIQALRVLIVILTLCIFIFLHIFLSKTKVGKAIRAASQNRELCYVVGINYVRICSITFLISFALAGMAGALVGPIFFLYPNMGTLMSLKAFAIIVLSGLGNVKGSIQGAIIVGLLESLVAGYFSATLKDMVVFLIMILALTIKPEGLFGKKVGIW